MMSDNNYRKPNTCPYCGYFCDAATMIDNEKEVPKSGDVSFCLMCCKPLQFNNDMKLIKFDINSIEDINFKEYLFNIQRKMEIYWKVNHKLKRKR